MRHQFKNSRRNAGSGFTLIELLVVIAIIAILASLLLPAIGRAQNLAKEVACLTNLHGIGVAVAMYAAEYNGLLCPSSAGPMGWSIVSHSGSFPFWFDIMHKEGMIEFAESDNPYPQAKTIISDSHILHCPMAEKGPRFVSYGANAYAMGMTCDLGTQFNVKRAGDFGRDPSDVVLVGDGGQRLDAWRGHAYSGRGPVVRAWSGEGDSAYTSGFYWGRHGVNMSISGGMLTGGRCSLVMVDGHAKAYDGEFNPILESGSTNDFRRYSPGGIYPYLRTY